MKPLTANDMRKTVDTIAFGIVSLVWLSAALILLFAVPEFTLWTVVAKFIGVYVGVKMLGLWYTLTRYLSIKGIIHSA